MKRNMKLFFMMIPFLVLSGCIFSSTPPEGTIPLTWGENQTFKITGAGTFQWYLNDVALTGETKDAYEFRSSSYTLGTYGIKVKSNFVGVSKERAWTITVNTPPISVPLAASCEDIINAGLVCNTVMNCSDTVPQGDVISQSLQAGTIVAAGVTVTLTLSSGPCTSEVPVPVAAGCFDIQAAGLVCDAVQSCSNTALIGTVISQSPSAGTMVQPGTTVSLTISTGPCSIEVPVPLATSCEDIATAGLVCSRSRACSTTVPLGLVISQWPEAGAMVLPGSTVQLVLSTGMCQSTVPNATTCEEIVAAGLVCNTVLYCSNTVPEGGFMGISPAPGTGITPGSTVNLILSSGPCEVPVPTAASCADVEAAGMVCSVSTTCNNTVPAGAVISQSPAAGTMVPPGSTVSLVISSGVCAVQLAAPQNVQATDVVITNVSDPMQNHNLNDRVRITWNAVSNAGYYEIYRADSPTGEYTLKGTATAPATTYDDMQTETLAMPAFPSPSTTESLNAYEAAARPVVNDFKNYRYYKVKACSSSPLFTKSDFSVYNEGRIDYTLEEFFSVSKGIMGISLSRVMLQAGTIGLGTDVTFYDPCGDGNIHFTVSQSGLSGLLKLQYTNYIDSLTFTNGTLDCGGTRKLITNGLVSGTISLSGSGTLTGSVAFTGNYSGKYTSINIPVTSSTPQTGTCTVIYNGQQVTNHVFGL
jgi:beta-lactam-binding protein with PASTA domain